MSNNVIEYIVSLKDRMTGPLNHVINGLGRLGRATKEAFLHPIETMWRFKSQLIAIGGSLAGAWATVKKAFDMETVTVSFGVLFRDMERAKLHMKELAKIAAETPFELNQIAQSSKYLEVFSNGVLNTKEYILKLGDAAAATGNDIQELAFWMGRAYGSIKAGRPAGEAFMRLQEMGILSGDARNLIESMQGKGGANGESVWAALMQQMDGFQGGMKTLSQTGNGLLSTLKDNWSLLLTDIGNQFQGVVKNGIEYLITALDKLRSGTAIEEWAEKVKKALSFAGAFGEMLADKDTRAETLKLTGDALKYAFLVAAQEAGNYLLKIAPVVGSAIGSGIKAMLPDKDAKFEFVKNMVEKEKIVAPNNMFGWSVGMLGGVSGFSDKDKKIIEERWQRERLKEASAGVPNLSDYGVGAKEKLDLSIEALTKSLERKAAKWRDLFNRPDVELPGGKKPDKKAATPAVTSVPVVAAQPQIDPAIEQLKHEQIRYTKNQYEQYLAKSGLAHDRASRAQHAYSQAWAEWRSPEMFKQNQAEREAEAEDQKEWEKQRRRAETLMSKPESFLSDRDKAAVRLLKAEKEQAAAERALLEIAANTKATKDMLENLLQRK